MPPSSTSLTMPVLLAHLLTLSVIIRDSLHFLAKITGNEKVKIGQFSEFATPIHLDNEGHFTFPLVYKIYIDCIFAATSVMIDFGPCKLKKLWPEVKKRSTIYTMRGAGERLQL